MDIVFDVTAICKTIIFFKIKLLSTSLIVLFGEELNNAVNNVNNADKYLSM